MKVGMKCLSGSGMRPIFPESLGLARALDKALKSHRLAKPTWPAALFLFSLVMCAATSFAQPAEFECTPEFCTRSQPNLPSQSCATKCIDPDSKETSTCGVRFTGICTPGLPLCFAAIGGQFAGNYCQGLPCATSCATSGSGSPPTASNRSQITTCGALEEDHLEPKICHPPQRRIVNPQFHRPVTTQFCLNRLNQVSVCDIGSTFVVLATFTLRREDSNGRPIDHPRCESLLFEVTELGPDGDAPNRLITSNVREQEKGETILPEDDFGGVVQNGAVQIPPLTQDHCSNGELKSDTPFIMDFRFRLGSLERFRFAGNLTGNF
jgi:hypothetical protein